MLKKILAGILPAWLGALSVAGLVLPLHLIDTAHTIIHISTIVVLICICSAATSSVVVDAVIEWFDKPRRNMRRRPKGLPQ